MKKAQIDLLGTVKTIVLSTAAISASFAVPPSAQAQSSDGQIYVEYQFAQTARYQDMSADLQYREIFEAYADSMTQLFNLPRDIIVSFQECGFSNAYYKPETSEITICYELLDQVRMDFLYSNVVTAEDSPEYAISAGIFIFLHELGHALIHDFNLPVLGQEEDAADQIATTFLSFGGKDSLGIAWAAAFDLLITSEYESVLPSSTDEHSSAQERFYNIACLSYGSNPSEYTDIPEEILPESQKPRCIERSQQVSQAVLQLIQPHVRLQQDGIMGFQ
ncbi:DUF4344 domain-containing metallopeptidase [Nodosilinea nodulosa]|uniref:DUF4344 domain-containing metallopeptidase n=1 Tax=Nodosilinea nodulosa TaxID=416001 RepID=UPI0018C2A2B0|nr:DUF4344 domain-containing metallopeptidase [Nodosilinea nodulosa]